jgi:hypothetical protein
MDDVHVLPDMEGPCSGPIELGDIDLVPEANAGLAWYSVRLRLGAENWG